LPLTPLEMVLHHALSRLIYYLIATRVTPYGNPTIANVADRGQLARATTVTLPRLNGINNVLVVD
jgi:hypothetical protein